MGCILKAKIKSVDGLVEVEISNNHPDRAAKDFKLVVAELKSGKTDLATAEEST